MPHISVVSPVYCAEDCVVELCQRLKKSVGTISNDFEIILVEDRSPDNSWAEIVKQARFDPRVRGIRLANNVGQHKAITAGLNHASGDWVVVMDCDLQDPPEAIPLLYAKAREGYEIVLVEFVDRPESLLRQKMSMLFWKFLGFLSGMPFNYRIGNFRIMSRQVVKNFCSYREQSRLLGGIITLMGFTTTTLNLNRDERYRGKSSYNLKKLLSVAVDLVVSYSNKPLKISIALGTIIAVLAFILGAIIIIFHLKKIVEVPGWVSVMVSLYWIGGVIIANLGVVGYYIARTFEEVKRRPLYIIENITDNFPCDSFPVTSKYTGQVIWITGLSGAGKSTLADEVVSSLQSQGRNTILLDGDDLREVLNAVDDNAVNYNRDARLILAMKYAKLCKIIANQGATVVIATISLFKEVHSWNRQNLPGYFEVYINVPINELRQRDPKGVYRRYYSGELKNVAGLDLSIDEPESADWVIESESGQSVKILAEELLRKLKSRSKQ